MDFEIEPATALYGIAAFLGAITVVYFGSSLIFDLSPVTKSLAFFTSFIVFLSISMYLSGRKKAHSIISLVMTGISYLAFLSYTLGKFEVTEEGVFASLFLSSILFVVLGYLVSKGKVDVDEERLRYIISVVVIVGASLMLVDAASAQPTYSMDLNDEVVFEPGEEVVLGSLNVRNDFVLPRQMEEPSYDSCMNLDTLESNEAERGFYTDVDVDELIGGLETRSYNLTVDVHDTRFLNESKKVSVQQVEECPETRKNNTFYVFEGGHSNRRVEYVD